MEGRLIDHKAVYLDQTEAYIEAPYIDLGIAFTIACWIKLLPSTPYIRPILGSNNNGSSNGQFWFGVHGNNYLQLKNWYGNTEIAKRTNDPLPEKQWLHVVVSFVISSELSFFINGVKHPFMAVPSWQNPDSGSFAIGRFNAELPRGKKYRYFHGYLSDLYVFSRALNEEEIGKVMGK